MAHGIAINDLINKIDTQYGVILDADFTFLYKYWDDILINELDQEYPIIGTQASQNLGSKKSGDFPIMYAILFFTDILKKLKIDFRPLNPKQFLDTGYELREKYLENGYKGKIMNCKNTRIYKKGPFHKVICEEYYLNGLESIFACHFGRGSTLGIGKYKSKKNIDGTKRRIKIIYVIPIIGKYLLKFKGNRQKKRWIKICKRIVNSTQEFLQ